MKKCILVLTGLTVFTLTTVAQWDTLTSFNQVIHDLALHQNNLFIGGNFYERDGNTCFWSTYFDGSQYHDQTGSIGGSGIIKMADFDGTLYAVGFMEHSGNMGVSKWNGSTWESGAASNVSHHLIYADEDAIFIGGDNGIVRRKTTSTGFETFYDFSQSGNATCIMRYNGQVIFGGVFTSLDGTTVNHIASWNGSSWEALGDGLSGIASVMAVYKNELYVMGDFDFAGGEPVNGIARWNGSSWSDVGEGLTAFSFYGFKDAVVYNNELYVVGGFSEVDNVESKDIIKWNGSEWIAVGLAHNEAYIKCIEVYNSQLYVGTYDFDLTHLYRYKGSSGIGEQSVLAFNLYPNPVDDQLNLQLQLNDVYNLEIEITDLTGRMVLCKKIDGVKTIDLGITCRNLPSGNYLLTVKNPDNGKSLLVKKVVVL